MDFKTENERLNCCPFCGGLPNDDVNIGQSKSGTYGITCIPCKVTVTDSVLETLIDTWNNRNHPKLET